MATARVFNEKTKEYIEYFIEDRLKHNLDTKVIPMLSLKDKDCVLAIDGKEGCLSKGTLIKTSKGNIPVEELSKLKSFFVESLDIETDKKEEGKAICFKTGNKEVFEIETIDGRIIKATSKHTFFVMRNNKVYELPLSELNEGDELICQ
jgi:intein/homing endonuclease